MRDTIRVKPITRHRIPRSIWFVLALLLIVGDSTFGFVVLRKLHQSDAGIAHTRKALSELRTVKDLLLQGGWSPLNDSAAGDVQQPDACREARSNLSVELQRLHGLIGNDKAEAGRLNRLTALLYEHTGEPTGTAAATQPTPGVSPLQEGLPAGVDRTNAIAATVDDMLLNEQKQLEDRVATDGGRDTLTLGSIMLDVIVFGAFGKIVLVGVFFLLMRRDTQRRRLSAEAQSDAIREFEQRFRRIFEESPIGIVLARSEGQRIVQANLAFCQLLGYEPDDLVGMTIADLAHIDDRELLIEAAQQTPRPGHFTETRYLTHSGVVVSTRTRIAPLRSSNGHEALLLCLVEDITRQKLAEAELRQAQKMEAIGQLTGGIAHDFNNLLGVIIGNVEFLLDVVRDDQEHAELAKEILSSALSGADLTRRLLAFARRQTLQPRRIDLNAYLPDHIVIVRRLLGETIQIITTLAADLWSTRADPSQVSDALLNLAINARDAMPHGGSLLIQTGNAHLELDQQDADVTRGDYVVLSVTDTGNGMPPELLERVMEPFFTTKPPGAGSGLGLSMIYGFAKQSGGHLTIESEPGRGTTVRLYLPRAQTAGSDPVDGVANPALPKGDEAILLVDDNVEMRTVVRRHLASLGYQVSEAASGPAALAILRNDDNFDLLFTDVVMPGGMTGYQLAAVAQNLHPRLRVLFTTGYARALPGSDPVVAHPGAMLRKPYRKQELAVTVRAALEA